MNINHKILDGGASSPSLKAQAVADGKAQACVPFKHPISIPRDMPLNRLPTTALADFARSLPKVDLHRHLEGAISPVLYLDIARRHNLPRPADSVEALRPHMEVSPDCKSLIDFLSKFELTCNMFKSTAIITEVTEGVIQEACADNVKYLELRFAPLFMGKSHGIAPGAVVEAVLAGVKKSEGCTGVQVKLLLIMERDLEPEACQCILDLAKKYKDDGIVGIDLAGDEQNHPPQKFADIFQQAKQHNINITVHAGEAAGANNVKTSVNALGATRIGHGVRAIEDPQVTQLLVEKNITLELCPTSNVQTGAVKDMAAHPLREFLEQGVKVTINTDDPALSGIDHSHELLVSIQNFNLSLNELVVLMRQAIDAAFLSVPERSALHVRLMADLEAAWERFCHQTMGVASI